jgi:hypothetical protein
MSKEKKFPDGFGSIKLKKLTDKMHSREKWRGLGPFAVTLNDDETITVDAMGLPSQTVEPNQFSDGRNYWIIELMGGKSFISLSDTEQYGSYYKIGFGDGVLFPEPVLEKSIEEAQKIGLSSYVDRVKKLASDHGVEVKAISKKPVTKKTGGAKKKVW